MRILLTGASSFTGAWLARELSGAGHEVHATFVRQYESYDGVRAERINQLAPTVQTHFGIAFGSTSFLTLIDALKPLDVFCHHGAYTKDYRSAKFDYLAATALNTHELPEVLRRLLTSGCSRVVLTGSVFEAFAGAGSLPLRAFSSYGLSKTLSRHVFDYFCSQVGVHLDHFVIANPFGPYEEFKFSSYLAREWLHNRTPSLNSPNYVRDNIHVEHLVSEYRELIESASTDNNLIVTPTGYPESNLSFSRRLAYELGSRWNRSCPIEVNSQEDYSEPICRIGTTYTPSARDHLPTPALWDILADYYLRRFSIS